MAVFSQNKKKAFFQKSSSRETSCRGTGKEI
jgi:hypothetical protein